jgi:hypothetical protein
MAGLIESTLETDLAIPADGIAKRIEIIYLNI